MVALVHRRYARRGGIGQSAPVRAIEVEPSELPSAAGALLRFAVDVEATPRLLALPAPLAEAVAELVRTTARDVAALADQARRDAGDVLAAADLYRQLETLIIPASLR
jgi:hypothetical protein